MKKELEALVDALERRTRGETGKRFTNIVSPAMADAFVKAWTALGRNPDEVDSEWSEMARYYADIG